jgi:peptidoglycan/xylan/chitin deacetylase (PgdA/CDA1 family)
VPIQPLTLGSEFILDYLLKFGGLCLRPFFEGDGVALMFHRVLEANHRSKYTGLRGLEVLPSVYDELLMHFNRRGFKFLSASELSRLILLQDVPKKFVVVTFDDGYKDNAEFVAEYMHSKNLPWTLYLATGLCDRTLPCWWYGLGDLLDQVKIIDARPILGDIYHLSSATFYEKDKIYSQLRNLIHGNWADAEYRLRTSEWFKGYGVDLLEITEKITMTWDDVVRISKSGCDIGAHTAQHLNLLNCSRDVALGEMKGSKTCLEKNIGRTITTLAYPFGDVSSCGVREFELAKEAGYDLAFTTRNKWISKSDLALKWSLPRINIAGGWDSLDQISFRVSGWSVIREEIGTRLLAKRLMKGDFYS